jgi:hypothetical protein
MHLTVKAVAFPASAGLRSGSEDDESNRTTRNSPHGLGVSRR